MTNIGLSTWLLMGMVITGIYVLPSVTAKFQGSHSMEFAEDPSGITNASAMLCGECHKYIQDELNVSNASDRVVRAHIGAINNREYTNDDNSDTGFLELGNITLTIDISGNAVKQVCPLCHATEGRIDGSHTQVTTRICTDADCHGHNDSKAEANALAFPIAQNVTQKIYGQESIDVHGDWYEQLENKTSTSPLSNQSEYAPDGHTVSGTKYYGYGYLTCMACHTHFGMNMNITRPQSFNINISVSPAGVVTINATNPINQTDVNTTYSTKAARQSVWQDTI